MQQNPFFLEVSGAGLPEVDGLFVPSAAPPATSESGIVSAAGYWNHKMAWDRADGRASRSPAISYSHTYRSWRISRLDGHLAYHVTCEDDLPPTDREWDVYKMGVAPAPQVILHHYDPRLPVPTPNVVFVLGGPGAGKGTMCELAELQLGWVHLSMGELLREEANRLGPQALEISTCLADGKLVPNPILVRLLQESMEYITRTTGQNNFLLDGFPRSLDNLAVWQEVFGDRMPLPRMLYFECPLPELKRRILGRAPFSGRSDDNLQSIQLRFETFKIETLPIIDYFKQRGRCNEIDTSHDRKVVYQCLREHLAVTTDPIDLQRPLCERAEVLLGLRPYPKQKA